MGILKNFQEGNMDNLRSLKYSEFGVQDPFITKEEGFEYNQINSRTTDLERFTKLLSSKPGLKFQLNQAFLQQADIAKDLRGGNIKKNLLQRAIKTATSNAASTLSILAQVPVNGTGTHFIRGLVPDSYLKNGVGRGTRFGQFLQDLGITGGVNGAKSALLGQNIGSDLGGPLNAETELESRYNEGQVSPTLLNPSLQNISDKNDNAGDIFSQAISLLGRLTSSPQGPEVTPYIGTSARDKYTNRSSSPSEAAAKPSLDNKVISTNVARTKKSVHWTGKDSSAPYYSDFVNSFVLEDTEKISPKLNYAANNERGENKTSYQIKSDSNGTLAYYKQSAVNIERKGGFDGGAKGKGDRINLNGNVSSEDTVMQKFNTIPFNFSVITPEQTFFLTFRAYLDSLSDSYRGNWNGTKYLGRAEEFYTYDSFNRDLTFSFKVATLSKEELAPLYKKLNHLAGTTAPTYTESDSFMRGTLVTLSIGEYLDRVTGFISSITFEWQSNYPWEVDLFDEGTYKVPHILDVSVNFTPIHDFNVKSDIDVETGDVYIGPKVERPLPTESTPQTETEDIYFEGKTVTVDKQTRETLSINNQPIPEDYQQYGLKYDPEFGRTVHISPDGEQKFDPVKRVWVPNK